MPKCLFGWIYKLFRLICYPCKVCSFMSEDTTKKCFLVAACSQLWEFMTSIWIRLVVFFTDEKRNRGKKPSDSDDVEWGHLISDEVHYDSTSETVKVDIDYEAFTDFAIVRFPLWSRVRFVDEQNQFHGGTVVRTGYEKRNPFEKVVIVRLDEGQLPDSTDGKFKGMRLMPEVTGVQFVMRTEDFLTPITLQDGDFCLVASSTSRLCMPTAQGFVRKIAGPKVTIYPYDMDYTKLGIQNQSKFEFSDYLLTKAPPPVTDEHSDYVAPISAYNLGHFCGRNKGIQGRANSCYLDTLLFSLFTFSDVILNDLLDMERKGDVKGDAFFTALNCLRYAIVYPLRASHFVSEEHVDYLRRTIAKETGKEQFEGETRDIPECMEALFRSIFGWTPPLEVGSVDANGEAFFNTSFVVEIFSTEDVTIPTTQNLLENASLTMEFCFKKTPSFMIIQLPRQDGQSSIVIPSLELDLKNILHRSVKECSSCRRTATLQFPELYEANGLAGTFLCRDCAESRGLNTKAARQLPEPLVPDGEEPDSRLALSAVLCIKRSHYNCFARCEDRWVFFDSMSDQEELLDHNTNKQRRFNIPTVEPVPNFCEWITQSPEEYKKDRLSSFLARKPENESAERVFSYAYMCLYSVNT